MQSGDSGSQSGAGGLPGAREQGGDGLHRVIGQPCDDIDQVGLGIDPLLPAVFDEGEQVGQTGTGAWVADRLPVLGAEFQRANAILGRVIVDQGAGFAQAALERTALAEKVVERLPKPSLRFGVGDGRESVGEEFVGQRHAAAGAKILEVFRLQLEPAGEALDAEELVDRAQLGRGGLFASVHGFYKVAPRVSIASEMPDAAVQPADVGKSGGPSVWRIPWYFSKTLAGLVGDLCN